MNEALLSVQPVKVVGTWYGSQFCNSVRCRLKEGGKTKRLKAFDKQIG